MEQTLRKDIPAEQEAEMIARDAYDLYSRKRMNNEFQKWIETYPSGFYDTEKNRKELIRQQKKLEGDIMVYDMMCIGSYGDMGAYDNWVSTNIEGGVAA